MHPPPAPPLLCPVVSLYAPIRTGPSAGFKIKVRGALLVCVLLMLASLAGWHADCMFVMLLSPIPHSQGPKFGKMFK